MPNWCSNHLTLTHADPAMIERVKTAFLDNRLLNEFAPCPQELVDTLEGYPTLAEKAAHEAQVQKNRAQYGYATWYDFRIENWGTKWDVKGSVESESSNAIVLRFGSAWSPPLPLMEKLKDEFGFTVELMFAEEGMAVCGIYTSDGGLSDYDIPSTSEELRQRIPACIDEAFSLSEQLDERNAEDEYEDEDDGGNSGAPAAPRPVQ